MNTPILFLVFNRPDTTQKVFESIRQARPPKLYVVADGPRSNRINEASICDQVRLIATDVDWDCEDKTLFISENLGCKLSVSQGISWFFQNEEEGIVIEDDVLPSQDFYDFCEFSLHKYKNKPDIAMICGFNPVQQKDVSDAYYFSRIPFLWGWATAGSLRPTSRQRPLRRRTRLRRRSVPVAVPPSIQRRRVGSAGW